MQQIYVMIIALVVKNSDLKAFGFRSDYLWRRNIFYKKNTDKSVILSFVAAQYELKR